ncbi:MAG: TolC family protein [Deltaproteobacteria bacterium]|nr:TolC family protein [Deltaproteobacteria bacterium]
MTRYQCSFIAIALSCFTVAVCPPAAAVDGDTGGNPASATAPDPGGEPKSQGYRAASRGGDAPWGGTDENTLRLSVDEAIGQAIENNLGVQIQRFNPLIAEEELEMAWGAYDPGFEAEIGYDSTRNPNALQLDGNLLSISKLIDGTGGFRGVLPFLSTQYSAMLGSQRTETNSTIQGFSPEYRSTTIFAITQPLLKDLIWNQPWTRVKITNINYDASIEDFRLALMDIVAATEDGYWELIASHEDMLVAQKSLETAQALLRQTQTQYDVGVVSKVEVIQSDAGVADREFRLIVAENRYRLSQDNLIDIVLGERLRPDTTLAIEPTDRADEFVHYDVDIVSATRVAFASRPELELANQQIDRLSIQQKFAKNQRLPRFDVVGTYAYRGLSGKTNPNCGALGPCPQVDEPWSASWNDFYASDGANNYSVRGLFSIPIPNTTGRARYSQAQIELRQASTQKRRIEQDIIFEIRKAARDLESAQNGIEASDRGVTAAAEQLRAEEIRLEYGESTPFDVLLREESLVEAESRMITSLKTYRSSLTALDRRQGTILRNRNIAIDAAMGLR